MKSSSDKLLIVLSFLAIYLIWGSTYLFIAFAVEEIPPFLLAGLRFFLAGLIVILLIKAMGNSLKVSSLQLKNALLGGFFFLTIGSGGVFYALQFVDSGVTALIISGQPLILLMMMWVINRSPLPAKSFAGVFIGIVGMYLLVSQDELTSGDNQWIGILAIFISMLMWGYGSIFVSKAEMPKSTFLNTGIQMISGGASLVLIALLFEDQTISWSQISMRTWTSLVYLIIFGSIVAFSAFNYLLQRVSPEKVATNTYVNPVVALLLGFYFRDEYVSLQSIAACAILFTGVYFINSSNKKPRHTAE